MCWICSHNGCDYPLRFILLFLYLKNFLAAPSQFGYISGSFNTAFNLFILPLPALRLQLSFTPLLFGTAKVGFFFTLSKKYFFYFLEASLSPS